MKLNNIDYKLTKKNNKRLNEMLVLLFSGHLNFGLTCNITEKDDEQTITLVIEGNEQTELDCSEHLQLSLYRMHFAELHKDWNTTYIAARCFLHLKEKLGDEMDTITGINTVANNGNIFVVMKQPNAFLTTEIFFGDYVEPELKAA